MIKIGDKVSLFRNIAKTGVVVELKRKPVKTWFAGGAASQKLFAVIRDDKTGELETYDSSALMRLE